MSSHHSSRTHRDRSRHGSEDGFIQRCSDHVIDAALMASVSVVPCLLGGRIAYGHLALTACATLAVVAWSAGLLLGRRPTWTVTWVEPLLLGGVSIGLLQITPLPTELLNLLSPHLRSLLPLWSATTDGVGGIGSWTTLSLHVAETRWALITGINYVLLFYVATQRIRRIEDVERLLKSIACASGAMALFGVVQWLSNNGKFFWFYDYPLTTAGHRLKGAFTNRNHFAQFLVLGCGPLLWWILCILERRSKGSASFGSSSASSSSHDTLLAVLFLGLGVVVFSVLFSLSRGGTLALGVSLLVMLSALYCSGRLSGRLVSVLLGIAMLSGSLFLLLGHEKVFDRLDNWRSDSRLAIWQANLQITGDFPWLGTGLGSHVEAYPIYFDPPYQDSEFTHADNSYLQVASESGLCGLSLALLSVSCCVVWCCRSLRSSTDRRVPTLAAAITASLAGNIFHAAFDFVWYVPGLMTVVLLLIACARRLDQLSLGALARADRSGQNNLHSSSASENDSKRVFPRLLGLAAGTAAVFCAWWSFPQLNQIASSEPYWFDYLRLSLVRDLDDSPVPAAEEPDKVEDKTSAQLALFKQRVSDLMHTTKLNPDHARAQLRLATSYLTAFEHLQQQSENPMTLAQLRDAALASQFASVGDMREWLQRAVGPNLKYLDAAARHAQKAVRLCPLQGQAYVHLAELHFLEDADPKRRQALLNQAELVRPHSAQVQFVVGREALQQGHIEEALQSWKQAFHQERSYQAAILGLLVGTAPAQLILESLEPDLAALEQLELRYRDLPTDEYNPTGEYGTVARAYAQALKSELLKPECERPVERLLSAAAVYTRLQDAVAAEACLRRAIDIDSSSFVARYAYGMLLSRQNRFASASEHLGWCLRVKPNDDSLRRQAEEAVSRSLKSDASVRPAGHESVNRRKRH